MNESLRKFLRDLLEAGIAGACASVLALNLDAVSAKGVTIAAATGFIAAAIAASRRYLVTTN